MTTPIATDSVPSADACRRVVVATLSPRIDHGAVAVKRVVSDVLRVRADLVCDGHDLVGGALRFRRSPSSAWEERPLTARGNDRFDADLTLDRVGRWEFTVDAWVDAFASWRDALARRIAVNEVANVDLAIGAQLLVACATRAAASGGTADATSLREAAARLADEKQPLAERAVSALDAPLLALAATRPDRRFATRTDPYPVVVDPQLARAAAWYELFPRSTGVDGAHGTFRTAETWLPYVRDMGFDVVYLPPVHPIGRAFRKGKNNSLAAGPDEPGSPWAIGGLEGGHTAVHPALGTLDDFDHFVRAASEHGLSVALDIAFQASPDHPWVREHPDWFLARPDGTIQYAENPPKKYQDVYPFHFECEDWRALWAALRDVFEHWIAHGVTIFRVDNPHTKPIEFWRWCIAAIKADHPEVTFLAEAFTRPKLKYALAKAGFSQGYTYFTWRNTKRELVEYLTELTATDVVEYFRPSFWPTTPDILPEELQIGGRPAYVARLVLAATLSSHYGIYGPAFELMESAARPGSGEYLANEKYEIKHWDRHRAGSLAPVLTAVNRIRREHPALGRNDTLRFHATDNDMLLCYSKSFGDDLIVVVVTLDFAHRQSGWITFDLDALAVDATHAYQVHDLLGGGRFLWHGARNYVELDPVTMPAQVFAVRRKVRTERDFDYFL